MNILLTSVGRRNYIVDYFKKALNSRGRVFAADCSATAPALYSADSQIIMPSIRDENYVEHLIEVCKKNEINAVLSLIDPELSILSENRELFEKEGIKCIVSEPEAIEICFDKYKTYKFLRDSSLPYVKTYISSEDAVNAIMNNEIKFPVIVKPKKGSASRSITKAENKEELLSAMESEDGMIAQEFMDCPEWGIDVFVDFISGEVINIFTKKKLQMRAGETDKAVSVKDTALSNMCRKLVEKLGLRGPIDIDCFETKDGFVISEINPRFGGGYPLAYACNVDFAGMILRNISGEKNEPEIGKFDENRFMFKQISVCIKNKEELAKK